MRKDSAPARAQTTLETQEEPVLLPPPSSDYALPEPAREPPSQNVLITASRTYVLPPSQVPREQSQLNALQRNCENAVRNNLYGQYPATQRQACGDYARFAARLGLEVDLPQVREAPAAAPRQRFADTEIEDTDERARRLNCPGLYQHKHSLEARMRMPHGAREAEALNESMRQVIRRLDQMRCTETGSLPQEDLRRLS